MKINKIKILASILIVLVAVVGCTPKNTSMNTRNRNLSTQTRVTDPRWNIGQDNLNRNLNYTGQDGMLHDGIGYDGIGYDGMGYDGMRHDGRNLQSPTNISNRTLVNDLNYGTTHPNNVTNVKGHLTNNANDIARKIAALPEVDKASVVLTHDTALVGCSLRGNTQGTMTNALKSKIEKVVKDTTSNVKNISITTDPHLYSRIETISTNVGNGNPIEGFAEEVRELIRRITPNINTNTVR